MTPSMSLSIITQIASAVAHLHTGPHICHRDIKPENITLAGSGSGMCLKLVDFDLAIIREGGATCCSICGTLPFMAPEVMFSFEYDGFAADIWSLGVVFFETLCEGQVI